MEPVRVKPWIAQDGAAQTTNANHSDVPGGVDAQYLAQSFQEVVHAIAAALFSETPKIAEVFANLGRGYLKFFSQLLGANHLNPVFQQPVKYPHVLRKPTDDDFRYFRAALSRFGIRWHGVFVPSPTAICWQNHQFRTLVGEPDFELSVPRR